MKNSKIYNTDTVTSASQVLARLLNTLLYKFHGISDLSKTVLYTTNTPFKTASSRVVQKRWKCVLSNFTNRCECTHSWLRHTLIKCSIPAILEMHLRDKFLRKLFSKIFVNANYIWQQERNNNKVILSRTKQSLITSSNRDRERVSRCVCVGRAPMCLLR